MILGGGPNRIGQGIEFDYCCVHAALALKDLGFETAGKTGTAEYTSDKSKSHAWFVGFSDTGDQDIAVCVLVEERGSGSEYAVPIARQIFQEWYGNKALKDLMNGTE